MHKHLCLFIKQQTLSWNLWDWDIKTEILFQSIYPSRYKACLQKALTDNKQIFKEKYGQSRHAASNYALKFQLISAQGFLVYQLTSILNHPVAWLFHMAIQASHEPCQIFTTTMSFSKEFHSSAACCIKKKTKTKKPAFLCSKLVHFFFLPIIPSSFTGRA